MKKCLSCNKLIKRGHGIKKEKDYCTYQCYLDKPPRVIEIEKEFQDTIKNLLKESEKMNYSQTMKAHSIGINRGTYRVWKLKYLEGAI